METSKNMMNTDYLTPKMKNDDLMYYQKQKSYYDALSRLDTVNSISIRVRVRVTKHEFLENRESAMPTELYWIIASYCDRQTRVELALTNHHSYHQVVFGPKSGYWVWRDSKLEDKYRAVNGGSYGYITATSLFHASCQGSVGAVITLLKSKANIDTHDNYKQETPLHAACLDGHIEVVDILLSSGADIHALSYNNETPLCLACGYLSIVRLLLSAGADANCHRHSPPILGAAWNNSVEVVDELLKAGADINVVNKNRQSVFHHKGLQTHMILHLLSKSGVNQHTINYRDCFGHIPLHYTVTKNDAEVVRALLNAGADPNICNILCRSPLMSACHLGYIGVVKVLLDGGADTHLKEPFGHTALSMARTKKRNVIVALLIAAGAEE